MLGLTKEFKEKWLKALTDGSYFHYKGHLVSKENDRYRCCLGVAKALMWKPANTRSHYLDDEDLEELGLLEGDGDVRSDKIQYELAELNDASSSWGGPYPAEVIEKIRELPVRDE